jgi:D-serine deaminase-like pyridoxal phosphate-dependent protein
VAQPSTPFLQVDLGRLEANLARTAEAADDAGVALRPHAKTHKCPEIARRQIELGAVGLTVATLGEAEVFVEHGCTDVFVAYPAGWTTSGPVGSAPWPREPPWLSGSTAPPRPPGSASWCRVWAC